MTVLQPRYSENADPHARASRNSKFIGIALATALIAGGWLLYTLKTDSERQEMQWRGRLQHIASATAGDLDQWVSAQFRKLNDIAANPAFQMYFLFLQQGTENQTTHNSEAPETGYLQQQLDYTAKQLGLKAPGGIVLTDLSGNPVISSTGMAPLNQEWRTRLLATERGKDALLEYAPTGDAPQIGFVTSVYGVQSDPSSASQKGLLLAIATAEHSLTPLLAPQGMEQTLSTALLRQRGSEVSLPRADLRIWASAQTEKAPWTVVAGIDRAEALSGIQSWQKILAALGLIAALALGVAYALSGRKPSTHAMALMRERERRVHILQQLTTVLVSLIDKRDPHAAEHSIFVAHVSAGVARELRLDTEAVDMIEMAARLMNIGKTGIPQELLTRTTALNAEERLTIRSSLAKSANLLEQIEFDAPIVDILRQTQERYDGTGPLRFRANEIVLPARVIAAANALVGMVSPRAWRSALTIDEALETMRSGAGVQFDPKVIEALLTYVEVRGGRELLANLTRRQTTRGEGFGTKQA